MNRKLYLITVLSGFFLATAPVSAQFMTRTATPAKNSMPNHSLLLKKAGLQPDSALIYTWNTGSQEFDSSSFDIFTYNGNTTITLQKSHQGYLTGRYTSTLNASEKVVFELYEIYYQDDFLPSYKRDVHFDNKGNSLSSKYYEYAAGTARYVLKSGDSSVLTYDGSGRLSEIIGFNYDEAMDVWEKLYKTVLSYTGAATEPSVLILYGWDNNTWVEDEKSDNIKWALGYSTYDDAEPTSYRTSRWDGTSWEPDSYDSSVVVNNRIVSSFSYSWDGTSIDISDRDFYTYDAAGNLFSYVSEYFDGSIWEINYGSKDSAIYGTQGEVLLNYNSYSGHNGGREWIFQSKRHNYFGPNLSVKETLSANAVKIYPNPALGNFAIEKLTGEVLGAKIYSIEGKEMLQMPLESGMNQVQTNGWKSGIYFIRLEGAKATSTQKIVVR